MKKVIRIILLVILCIAILFPLIYSFQLSLFSRKDFLSQSARFFPSEITFANYTKAFGYRYLPIELVNSLVTATLSATIKTCVLVLAAFAFSHMRFKGKKFFLVLLLATLFVPQDALLYQNYKIVARLGLLDTYLGIIAPTLFSASQMALLLGALTSYDKDYYDNARIDGASDMLYIVKILTPLTKSFLITIFLQSFIGVFNSYMWPLLVTNKPKTRTIQVGLTMLGFAEEGNIGAQMATIFMTILPFAIILAFSKKLIEKALINSSMHS